MGKKKRKELAMFTVKIGFCNEKECLNAERDGDLVQITSTVKGETNTFPVYYKELFDLAKAIVAGKLEFKE